MELHAAELFSDDAEDTGVNSLDDRAAWLATRATGIGGSDSAAILGLDPYRSPLEVWASKINPANDDDDDDPDDTAAAWGHRLEGVVLQEYARRTGRDVKHDGTMLRSRRYPLMMATLDGVQMIGGAASFPEVKTTALGKLWAERGETLNGERVPVHVQVQVQHSLLVTGAELATVVAFLLPERKLVHYDVLANKAFQGVLVERLTAFWRDHVQTGKPPRPIGRGAEFDVLAKLVPDEGEVIWLSESYAALLDQDAKLAAQAKAAKAGRKLIKSQLMYALGDAHQAILPDWRSIERRQIAPKATSCEACGHETPRNPYTRLFYLKGRR